MTSEEQPVRSQSAAPRSALPVAADPPVEELALEVTASAPAPQAGRSTQRAARNVVAVVASELLGKGATLAFTVLVARRLGAAGFGSFSYALAFGMLLATFIAWGFDSEVMRRGTGAVGELEAALSQALVLRSVHALPLVVVGGVVGVLTRPDASSAVALVVLLLAAVLDSYGDCLRVATTAREKPGPAAFALVLQRVAACVLAVAALAFGGGLVAVCCAYLLSSVVGEVLLVVLLRRLGLRFRWGALRRPVLRDMWRSTFVMGLDTVLGMALFRIDMLILGGLAGNEDVAEYAVGYRLMETVLFVTWAVSRSLLPAMVRAGGGAALRRVGENALAVAAALLVPYGVAVLLDGGAVLHLLFGTAYGEDSVVALQLLAFAPVAFALNYFCGYLLFLQDRKSKILLATGSALLLNVALNVVLIPLYGAPGAAIATTACYLVQGLARVAFVAPGAGVFRLDRALRLSVLASAPMAAILLLLHAPVLLECAIAGLVYVACYLALTKWRDPAQMAVVLSLLGRS